MKCTCCQQREGMDRGPGYGSFCEECLTFKGGECCIEWANDYTGWCKRTKINPHDVPDIAEITESVNEYLDEQDTSSAISAIKNIDIAAAINPKEMKKPKRKRHTCALGDFTTLPIACAKCFRNNYIIGAIAGATFIIIVVIIVLLYNNSY